MSLCFSEDDSTPISAAAQYQVPHPIAPAAPVMHTLTRQQYQALEDRCPRPVIGPTSTGFDGAYHSGVQFVLKLIRDGFTAG